MFVAYLIDNLKMFYFLSHSVGHCTSIIIYLFFYSLNFQSHSDPQCLAVGQIKMASILGR